MLQHINFAKRGLRYACTKKNNKNMHKKKQQKHAQKNKNNMVQIHIMVWRFRTSLGSHAMTVSICCINMNMQVQGDSLNIGRFVVWLLLLYFMRYEKIFLPKWCLNVH